MVEIVNNEFKNLLLKMINNLKESSNKQKSELNKLIQDLKKYKYQRPGKKIDTGGGWKML